MNFGDTVIDKCFEYFIAQVFKTLHLFEENDSNAHLHIKKTLDELEGFSIIFPEVAESRQFVLLLSKMEYLHKSLKSSHGTHREVKNHVFESIKLLERIKEDM